MILLIPTFNVIQAVNIDDMTLVVVSIDAIMSIQAVSIAGMTLAVVSIDAKTGMQAVSIDGMTLAVLSVDAMIICFVCKCRLVHPWFFPKRRLLKY